MNYKFGEKELLAFYFRFILDKFLIFKDCKRGKLPILISEILWITRPFTNIRPDLSIPIKPSFYETWLGKFYVNNDLQSIITVSPTFERRDIDYFLSLIRSSLSNKEKVLFIDVGAHIGIYSIGVANNFKKFKNLKIISFEPNANNFFSDNFSLLKRNVALNKLSNIKIYNLGLGSINSKKVNKFGFRAKMLDSILETNEIQKYDHVFMKIDIEGDERNALEGSVKTIEAASKLTLLIEDVVDKKIPKYLETRGFMLIRKSSPYNSFWKKYD